MPIDGTLLIARHQESLWNKHGVWTGSRDVHLTPEGKRTSFEMGLQLQEFTVQQAVCSMQCRSKETLDEMLSAMHQQDVPIMRSAAINERDYGDFTGKNKEAMRELMGDEEFNHMHRDYLYPIPHGESLKDVYGRAVPFYIETIVPLLKAGKNILLVSHGNTIRALTKYIEDISDDEIKDVEMLFGSILIYQVDEIGRLISRTERFAEI
jgi:2,3-bisphosphoglycerate-dependent phosphoglycerate mutase